MDHLRAYPIFTLGELREHPSINNYVFKFVAMYSDEVKKVIQQVKDGKAVVLDVRRNDEWRTGHAKDAVHLDSDRLLGLGESPDIDKEMPIYAYCKSGGRAGRVKNELTRRGFTQVYNLGGLSDWEAAGGEVETE